MSYPDPHPSREAGFPGLGDNPAATTAEQALGLIDRAERQLLELEDAASPWLEPEGLGLAAVLAHEIGNLLTPVSLYAARARRRPDDPQLAIEAAEHAEKALEQVNRLTETVLSLARASYRHETTPEPASALATAREALDELRLWSGDITLDLLGVPADLHLPIESSALQRVLVNLAGNALKAIQRSGVGSAVRITAGHDENRSWLIVEDNGPGIDSETASHLFDPWAQTSGHGLGLPLCRELVERRGGRLSYEPAEHGGSRFTLTF